jgi:hypothetical protein
MIIQIVGKRWQKVSFLIGREEHDRKLNNKPHTFKFLINQNEVIKRNDKA